MPYESRLFGWPHLDEVAEIASIDDARRWIARLPNRERGYAALALAARPKLIQNEVAYAGMMAAYEHDHREVEKAFGSDMGFARALRRVAPRHGVTGLTTAWRGIAVRNASPTEAMLALSWTADRDIACWFAMVYWSRGAPDARPFVFRAVLEPADIIARHDDRDEAEIIVDISKLYQRGVVVEDFADGIVAKSIAADARMSLDLERQWQEAADRFEARKNAANAGLMKSYAVSSP